MCVCVFSSLCCFVVAMTVVVLSSFVVVVVLRLLCLHKPQMCVNRKVEAMQAAHMKFNN